MKETGNFNLSLFKFRNLSLFSYIIIIVSYQNMGTYVQIMYDKECVVHHHYICCMDKGNKVEHE